MRQQKMAETDKFMSMVGFAKRARKIVYGIDSLESAKRLKLLAVSDSASDNLVSSMMSLATKRGVPLVTVDGLEDKVGGNCKALGITDENMARAMEQYANSGARGYRI